MTTSKSDDSTAIRLLPTTTVGERLNDYYVERFTVVKVSPSECFEVKEKGVTYYALGKPALDKIAAAAGITFDPDRSGVMGTPTRDYLIYKAVASMKLPDGTLITKAGTVEWAFEDVFSAPKRFDNESQARYDARVAQAEKDVRRFRLPMSETKAMLRVVRALLGLKSKYTADELKHPFEVPHYDYQPDMDKPAIRELVMAQAGKAQGALYGTSPLEDGEQRALAAAPEDISADDPTAFPVEEVEDYEEVTEGEVVEEQPAPTDEVPFDDFDTPAEGEFPADPADYIVKDEKSKFHGLSLGVIEKDYKAGYCKFVLDRNAGSEELRQACEEYQALYHPSERS